MKFFLILLYICQKFRDASSLSLHYVPLQYSPLLPNDRPYFGFPFAFSNRLLPCNMKNFRDTLFYISIFCNSRHPSFILHSVNPSIVLHSNIPHFYQLAMHVFWLAFVFWNCFFLRTHKNILILRVYPSFLPTYHACFFFFLAVSRFLLFYPKIQNFTAPPPPSSLDFPPLNLSLEYPPLISALFANLQCMPFDSPLHFNFCHLSSETETKPKILESNKKIECHEISLLIAFLAVSDYHGPNVATTATCDFWKTFSTPETVDSDFDG